MIKKKLKSFTVKRKNWVRGGYNQQGYPSLLNEKGNMCCLGFYSKACGVPKKDLKDKNYPSAVGVDDFTKEYSEEGLGNLQEHFIGNINDNADIANWEREILLKIHFKEFTGCNIKFVD